MLKINNLNVSYGGIKALQNVSLEVPEGKIVTLIGANGAGKSCSNPSLELSLQNQEKFHFLETTSWATRYTKQFLKELLLFLRVARFSQILLWQKI